MKRNQTKKTLKLAWWYAKIYWTNLKLIGLYSFAADAFYSLSFLIYSYLTAKIIDVTIASLKSPTPLLTFETLAKPYILYYLLVILIDTLFSFDQWFIKQLLIRGKLRWFFQESLLGKLTKLNYAKIENPKTQALFIKTWDQGSWPLTEFVQTGSSWIISVLSLIIYLLSLSHINFIYFIPLIILAAINGLIGLKQNRTGYAIVEKTRKESSLRWRIYDYLSSFNIILESKLSGAENYLLKKYHQVSKKVFSLRLKSHLPYSLSSWFVRFLESAAMLFIYWQLLLSVLNGEISIGFFSFYIGVVAALRSRISNVIWQINQLHNTLTYARYFYNFSHLKPSLSPGKHSIPRCRSYSTSQVAGIEIKFNRVWFKYPKSKNWTLKNISLTIRPTEKIALVGENGAGKTTILKLLFRLYYPQKGKITLNGRDIRLIKQKEILRAIRMIPQDFARYPIFTAAENIGISNYQKLDDRQALKQAAQLSGAWEFISKLPKQLKTPLSKELEKGVELSTGQWQKIALARLFFHQGRILVLDEPTASIDPISEYEIFQNIVRTVQNKTLIVVSHRYYTVRSMDKIYVIHEGRIIEQGNHRQLLQKNGYYAKAWKLQHDSSLSKH
jgi:ABC-type multidrug transport system fused ATPase/permease subunit